MILKILLSVIKRDLLLTSRRYSDLIPILLFFIVTPTLFPIAIGVDKAVLQTIAPGILWVTALLATLLSFTRLFSLDYADGTLEQMSLSPCPLPFIVMAKLISHWLLTGLPIAILTPFMAIQFDLPSSTITILLISLLIGTPALILIGAMGAALTLGARNSQALLALLIFPLYIPILIFGTGAVTVDTQGLIARPHLFILGALLTGSIAITPWIISTALRIALE